MGSKQISHNKVKLVDSAIVTDGDTESSVWYPVDGWVKFRAWVLVKSSGTPDLLIKIRFSPLHYQVLRDLVTAGTSITTAHYKEYTLEANLAAKILTEWDDSDDADLRRAASSAQLVVVGNTGTDDCTVNGYLGSFA